MAIANCDLINKCNMKKYTILSYKIKNLINYLYELSGL